MSTLTKPRPARKPPAQPVTHEELVGAARKHVAATKRHATTIMGDGAVNRSTRAQRAQRLKAEAFDRLDEILRGR